MRTSADLRARMVARHIAARGVRDARVLEAMGQVPREAFVPECLHGRAYDDAALPIGWGQTISQPYIVAYMIESARLNAGDRVLEVGAGSGYAAAVLSRVAGEVVAIEREPELVEAARARLQRLGYDNVQIRQGDGRLGWPDAAPFDAIIVSACGPDAPAELLAQLNVGGRLVMPMGEALPGQQLVCIERQDEHEYTRRTLGPVNFVPLWQGEVVGANQEGGPPCDAPR